MVKGRKNQWNKSLVDNLDDIIVDTEKYKKLSLTNINAQWNDLNQDIFFQNYTFKYIFTRQDNYYWFKFIKRNTSKCETTKITWTRYWLKKKTQKKKDKGDNLHKTKCCHEWY